MSNAIGIARLSDLFSVVYGSGIPVDAREAWLDTFQHIHNDDLESAARWIIAHRTHNGRVVPGEIWHALQAIGVTPDKFYTSKEFREDPAVIALSSHYEAMSKLPGITLAQWLEAEGLPSFKEAMDRYGDHPSSVGRLSELAQPEGQEA